MLTITMRDKEKYMKVAKICADWWGYAIRDPKFDAGSDSEVMMFSQMIAKTLVEPIDDLQISLFKEHLMDTIMEQLVDLKVGLCISCDYQPCQELADAADHAGISLRNFPWKTNMTISPDLVKVKCGYSAKYEKIYKK